MTIDNIIINESAYFYKLISRLNKNRIQNLFREVSKNRTGNYLLNEIRKVKNGVTYSTCIFKIKKHPSFLDDRITDEYEVKYAYLLIAEYNSFVIVNKLNIGTIDSLKVVVEEIDYSVISRLYIDDSTLFEKFSMQNMNLSDRALRSKSLEAINIRDSFSSLGANRYILNNLRLQNNGIDTYSLTPAKSKISKGGKRNYIVSFSDWVKSVVEAIENYEEKDTFLDVFAQPIDFAINIKDLNPIGVLFDFSRLLDEVRVGKTKIFYRNETGKTREISSDRFQKRFSRLFEVDDSYTDPNSYKLDSSLSDDLYMVKNRKTLQVSSKKLSRLIFDRESGEMNLPTYMRYNHNFCVMFDKPEYVYFSRTIFKDEKLLGFIKPFMSIFIDDVDLENIVDEKGDFTLAHVCFDANTCFEFIDTKLSANADFLLCDDLGNEWADFISIEGETIAFIHAKEGKTILSASAFHDITSQAQKNLGSLSASETDLNRKLEGWKKLYIHPKSATSINRLRKGDTVENAIEKFTEVLSLPNCQRKVYLVVNFISKARLEKELVSLRDTGKCQNRNEVIQILWLLSSLIGSCKEAGVDPYIVCKP